MAKWFVAGGLAIVAILILVWLQMQPDEPVAVARQAAASSPPPTQVAMVAEKAAPAKPNAAVAEAGEPAGATQPPSVPAGKLDPRSDEFFYKFDEAVPKILTRNAATCYEGRHGSLHRNQKLVLTFKTKIVKGEVTVRDVAIKESTLQDDALQTCFIQSVMRSSWKDDELPDWEQDDELVLNPERGMKKYWRDNIDYVGDVAPPL